MTGFGLGRVRRGARTAAAVGLVVAAAYYAYLVANPEDDCHHCSDTLGVHGDPLTLFALAANLLAWLIAAPLGALLRRRRGRIRG